MPEFLTRRDVPEGRRSDGSHVHVFDLESGQAPGCPGFTGLAVWPDFVDEQEAAVLLADAESRPFKPAQSGKAKQHFGPRMNFRQQRMNAQRFEGLPVWAGGLEARVRERIGRGDVPVGLASALDRFVTTDAFVLRYEEARGSNLDLHIDDLTAYGELILDLSLESDGWMTFLDGDPQSDIERPFACVRAPLPARSLALLFGDARRGWFHGIRDLDTVGRRTSITLRTLGSGLRSTDEGRDVMARAERVLPGSSPAASLRQHPSPGRT